VLCSVVAVHKMALSGKLAILPTLASEAAVRWTPPCMVTSLEDFQQRTPRLDIVYKIIRDLYQRVISAQ